MCKCSNLIPVSVLDMFSFQRPPTQFSEVSSLIVHIVTAAGSHNHTKTL